MARFALALFIMTTTALSAPGPVAPGAQPAPPDWKAGLAAVKITPEQPVFMAGYASRNRPFDRVTADLYAKALALEDAGGARARLVTADLNGFPAAVAEPICARIAERTGLKREQILLSASHTHTGPLVSVDTSDREGVPEAEARKVADYTRWLQDRVVEAAARAVGALQPARLSSASGVTHFVMNRREFTPNGVILGVNPRGLADRSVPVLRVDGADGKPRAALFGAAVHNTTLTGDCYEITGDYAGFAQAYIQEQQPGVQAMFLLGCAGDANPYPRGTLPIAREHGATLGREVCRLLEGRLQPVRGPLRVAFGTADLPLAPAPPHAELERLAPDRGMRGWVARQMLAVLARGESLPDRYRAPLSVWQFGEDLTMVGLSGEVVVDYVPVLERALGPLRLWLAAYCHDVYGYLPSKRVLAEGGYECRGLYAGGIGYFAPSAEDALVAKVCELAGRAGRRLP